MRYLLLTLLLLAADDAQAQEANRWTGKADEKSTNWSHQANWSQGRPPGPGDWIVISDAPKIEITVNHNVVARRLELGREVTLIVAGLVELEEQLTLGVDAKLKTSSPVILKGALATVTMAQTATIEVVGAPRDRDDVLEEPRLAVQHLTLGQIQPRVSVDRAGNAVITWPTDDILQLRLLTGLEQTLEPESNTSSSRFGFVQAYIELAAVGARDDAAFRAVRLFSDFRLTSLPAAEEGEAVAAQDLLLKNDRAVEIAAGALIPLWTVNRQAGRVGSLTAYLLFRGGVHSVSEGFQVAADFRRFDRFALGGVRLAHFPQGTNHSHTRVDVAWGRIDAASDKKVRGQMYFDAFVPLPGAADFVYFGLSSFVNLEGRKEAGKRIRAHLDTLTAGAARPTFDERAYSLDNWKLTVTVDAKDLVTNLLAGLRSKPK